jgi:predicted CXXCH cytochrome family protein
MQEFEITHTFGWYPLQQYLVPFPGGRLQCLPIAWDVREKRWFHLYPDAPLDPGDWLYWTNAGQNWNGMCAECHSTNLKKNFDVKNGTYRTTWSEIDVACEACHGPGSRHVAWAELPAMGRPRVDNYGLTVKTSGLGSRDLVELCAPCHSRRAILGDYTHEEPDLLDSLLPSLMTPELYFPDGQILDEVYVYGSFTQSKMYHRDVRCTDCHDAHSARLIKEGNALCLQCHRSEEYDNRSHHFHKKKGEKGEPIKGKDGAVLFEVGTGALCIECHMPGRLYMVIDYRPDHSFRIPRPDLSLKHGTPNACNRCHLDKDAQWSEEHMIKWYGPGRKGHYATTIDQGRKGITGAGEDLARLALDTLYPVVVRATALSLLAAYPGDKTALTFETALMDEEALMRHTALRGLNLPDRKRFVTLIAPLLYDPVKAVRLEAASRLAGEPARSLDPDRRKLFQEVLGEYVRSMEYSGDFAFGRFNLGNLYAALNRPEEAIENYRSAFEIDDMFYPAKVNLAMLYNRLGRKGQTERLLRDVLESSPELYDVHYSLGLLLSEMKRYREAVLHLATAARGLPERARIHYNLGLLLQALKRDMEAEAALKKALALEPDSLDFLYALADFYLKRGNWQKAEVMARRMIRKHPDQRLGPDLLEFIKKQSGGAPSF